MPEKIDTTWLAYALDAPALEGTLEAGVRRLIEHYGSLVNYPVQAQDELGPRRGLITISDADPAVGWPTFARSSSAVVAYAYPITGWRRVVGDGVSVGRAPSDLGSALLADPSLAARKLPAPAVIGVVDVTRERLVIVNDFIGVGRLYEYRFDAGTIWSNRAAAPLLFSGRLAEASERGWRILAAAMWPVGDSTPFRDVTKVPAGTVIEVTRDGVAKTRTHAIAPLVETRRRDLKDLAGRACARALVQVRDAGELWPGPIDVDLSGGRDSRVVAAAVVNAGVEACFLTSDVNPGEAQVACEVVESSPVAMPQEIRKAEGHEPKPHADSISARALNVHLLHDGMRHPQKLRGKMTLPRSRPASATMSGHGGDVAHGYFYKSHRQLMRLRLGGGKAVSERVRRLFAKDHAMGSPDSYDAAQAEAERVLDEARGYGVRSPIVLEYFYLVDRFAHRQGLGAHVERVSIFGTQEFVEAAFALTPSQRLASRLHRLMIAELVPEWTQVPFFQAQKSTMREVRRLRLWEAPADAADVEAILAAGGPWTQLYESNRATELWRKLTAGEGRASWEGVFEGIVYREAFENYLRILRSRASDGPALSCSGS